VPVIVLGAAVMTVPAACPLVASATYVNDDWQAEQMMPQCSGYGIKFDIVNQQG
jgi:hypothetical protein